MKAENRLLPEWFDLVRSGRIRLPRFQRYEVWGQGEITGLLETVLHGLPAGATLVMDVQGEEKFASRTMSGAPEPTERCREHLLDGQQRVTALGRAFTASTRTAPISSTSSRTRTTAVRKSPRSTARRAGGRPGSSIRSGATTRVRCSNAAISRST